MQTPPHLPLTVRPRPFECAVDQTEFVDLDEAERRNPTHTQKKNFAIQGRVRADLAYPFLFSSRTYSLSSLWSSYTPTKYTGVGIRYNASGLEPSENQDGVAAYHHVLDDIHFTTLLNKVMETDLKQHGNAAELETGFKTLTGRVLVLLLELKKLRTATVAAKIGVPLLTSLSGLDTLLCGVWEDIFATAYQMRTSEAVMFGTEALVRACAAYHYFSEASKTADFAHLAKPLCAVAQQRLSAVLIGWIVLRIPQAQQPGGKGVEIPWAKGDTSLDASKYRTAVLAALGISGTSGAPTPAPAAQYEAVYKKADTQCRVNALPVRHSVLGVSTGSHRSFSTLKFDPYEMCARIGRAWATPSLRHEEKLFENFSHPQPPGAHELWAWESQTEPCPASVRARYEEARAWYVEE